MLRRVILISLTAVVCGCIAANRASAQTFAEYEVSTGRLTFKNLHSIYVMRLLSSSNGLIPGAGTDMGFLLTEKTAGLYSWFTFGPPVTSAALSPGIIAQPNLPPDDLYFDYVWELHSRSGPVIRIEIPEPSTIVLSAMGLVGAVVLRRCRAGKEPVPFNYGRVLRAVAGNRAAKNVV